MKRLLILLIISVCTVGPLEASDDIDKQMAYINSITSSNAPTLSFESTLPTIDIPVIPAQENGEIVVARQEAE